ncbi:MAG: sigma-70 family RNA polymerase sigma factor [Planctomycetota bacterium]
MPATSTRALAQAENAPRSYATDELLPLVYDELRALAERYLRSEHRAHTLQATALAHEAYLRLCDAGQPLWDSRAHFFGAAARAVRRVLVEHARSSRSIKRGGGRERVPLGEQLASVSDDHDTLLSIDDALARLAEVDPLKARVVELRFFGGLSIDEIAAVLELSTRTVLRHWQFAKAWLWRDVSWTDHEP